MVGMQALEGSQDMQATLERLCQGYLEDRFPDARQRIDRLDRLIAVLSQNQKRLCEAAEADFGGRPVTQTRMEIFGAVESLRYARKHVRAWMKPEKRPVPLIMRVLGARAWVFHQPLGVVGCIAPWNFPIVLVAAPLAGIFAAGNRAMVKPSELTPQTSALLKELLESAFDATELAVVTGGPDTAAAFSRLPFDHLMYTGSTAVARHVMRAAADHLVPVTLELGGKCPVIVGTEADLRTAAERVVWGKIQNVGQICLAPDYVFVPRGREEAFLTAARETLARWYPEISGNPDYCAVVNQRHFERVSGYLQEAGERGARVETLSVDGSTGDASSRRVAPAAVVSNDDALAIARDEVFGPVFALRTYDRLDEVIGYINARPRPLALYYFGSNSDAIRRLQECTTAGGMSINDIAGHAATESLPLGGVGASGMGAYHGRDGFLQFSHAKAVFRQGRFNLAKLFDPPYTDRQRKLLDRGIGPM